jgi:uncharacterized protein YndB with AHSA1/START domain
MFTVEASIHIQQPVHRVYACLLDPANYPRWIADVRVVRASAPLHVGQRFEEVTLFHGREKASTGEVVMLRPDEQLVLRITAVQSGPRLLPTRTFTLQPLPDGTALHWRSEVQTAGLMRLFEPLLPRLFRRKKAGYLAALKVLLEGMGTSAAEDAGEPSDRRMAAG